METQTNTFRFEYNKVSAPFVGGVLEFRLVNYWQPFTISSPYGQVVPESRSLTRFKFDIPINQTQTQKSFGLYATLDAEWDVVCIYGGGDSVTYSDVINTQDFGSIFDDRIIVDYEIDGVLKQNLNKQYWIGDQGDVRW